VTSYLLTFPPNPVGRYSSPLEHPVCSFSDRSQVFLWVFSLETLGSWWIVISLPPPAWIKDGPYRSILRLTFRPTSAASSRARDGAEILAGRNLGAFFSFSSCQVSFSLSSQCLIGHPHRSITKAQEVSEGVFYCTLFQPLLRSFL